MTGNKPLMLDHPGWFVTANGWAQRAFQHGDTVSMITCRRDNDSPKPVIEIVHHTTTPANACPTTDTYNPATLPALFRDPLLTGGTNRVRRVRNPDIWDATLPPLLNHRRPNTDGARLYRALCRHYGTLVTTDMGSALLPPRPETLTQLDDKALTKTGITGTRADALRTVAREFLRLHPHLPTSPHLTLFTELQQIPHIGKRNAARIVADTTGDFSLHAHAGHKSDDHWSQFAAAMGTTAQPDTYRNAWKALTHTQQSTLVALTTHHDQSLPSKTEATRSDHEVRYQPGGAGFS